MVRVGFELIVGARVDAGLNTVVGTVVGGGVGKLAGAVIGAIVGKAGLDNIGIVGITGVITVEASELIGANGDTEAGCEENKAFKASDESDLSLDTGRVAEPTEGAKGLGARGAIGAPVFVTVVVNAGWSFIRNEVSARGADLNGFFISVFETSGSCAPEP